MRTKVQEIRNEAINNIKALMGVLNRLEMVDIDEGNSHIVCENTYDVNLTTTLDSIVLDDDGHLIFYHSSSCSNGWLSESEIPTDALIDIAEFLEERKEQIQDIINETDVTADDNNMPRDMLNYLKENFDIDSRDEIENYNENNEDGNTVTVYECEEE